MNDTPYLSIEHGGCRLAYKVVGDGPPVIFIQGSGIHGEGWLPQVDPLSKQFRCLWFDNRGMGRSQPLVGRLAIEQMALDVGALMDAQGWKSAHVVGHSLGGLVAICFALSARSRVRSLSLLCTFSRGADATRLSWDMFWLGLRTYVGTRRMRRRAFLEMVMPQRVLAESDCAALTGRLAPLFGHDLADHPPVVMKQLGAMRSYDATPRLGSLAGIPTLVVAARHDRIAKLEVGKALAPEVNALLHEFLSQVPAERDPTASPNTADKT